MKAIISAFDELFTLYSRRHHIESEIELAMADISLDFDRTDFSALNKLAQLKREEISYFFENGYLSDREYNDGISALFNIEQLKTTQEGEKS